MQMEAEAPLGQHPAPAEELVPLQAVWKGDPAAHASSCGTHVRQVEMFTPCEVQGQAALSVFPLLSFPCHYTEVLLIQKSFPKSGGA